METTLRNNEGNLIADRAAGDDAMIEQALCPAKVRHLISNAFAPLAQIRCNYCY